MTVAGKKLEGYTPEDVVQVVLSEIEGRTGELGEVGCKSFDEIVEVLVAKYPTIAQAPTLLEQRDRCRAALFGAAIALHEALNGLEQLDSADGTLGNKLRKAVSEAERVLREVGE